MRSRPDRRRGAATVEYVALAGMIGILIITAIAALVASPPTRGERELGEMLARRIACTPRYPVPCGRNPLALAYGFPLGKLVRFLAPTPAVNGGELPVDFRYCRQPSCAGPGSDPGLTSSRRRVTEFTSVEDLRRSGGSVRITYWLYRPGPALGANRSAPPAPARSTRRPAFGSASRTTPPWSRSRPSPAATTTASRRARILPGAGQFDGLSQHPELSERLGQVPRRAGALGE